MRRTITGLVATLFAIGLTVLSAPAANAAPIDCPAGQTVTKTSGGWDCVNKADKPNQSEDPKNPNVGKGFF